MFPVYQHPLKKSTMHNNRNICTRERMRKERKVISKNDDVSKNVYIKIILKTALELYFYMKTINSIQRSLLSLTYTVDLSLGKIL